MMSAERVESFAKTACAAVSEITFPFMPPQRTEQARLVGLLGEFRDRNGRVCPCRVSAENDGMLLIDYWNRDSGGVIYGAMIVRSEFTPDEPLPNSTTNP